jgi:hypothetical protein
MQLWDIAGDGAAAARTSASPAVADGDARMTGQDRFKGLARVPLRARTQQAPQPTHPRCAPQIYYKDAAAALILYDTCDMRTFKSVMQWKEVRCFPTRAASCRLPRLLAPWHARVGFDTHSLAGVVQDINQKVLLPNGQPIPVFLIGTKIDLDET